MAPLVFHSTEALRKFLATDGRDGRRMVPETSNVVGVHFQMRKLTVDPTRAELNAKSSIKVNEWAMLAVAISAATYVVETNQFHSNGDFVLDVMSLDEWLLAHVLRELLENKDTIKVLFDIHLAASWLGAHGLREIELEKCVDAQLVFEMVSSGNGMFSNLTRVYQEANSLKPSAIMRGVMIKALLDYQNTSSFQASSTPPIPAPYMYTTSAPATAPATAPAPARAEGPGFNRIRGRDRRGRRASFGSKYFKPNTHGSCQPAANLLSIATPAPAPAPAPAPIPLTSEDMINDAANMSLNTTEEDSERENMVLIARLFPMLSFEELRYYSRFQGTNATGAGTHLRTDALVALSQAMDDWYRTKYQKNDTYEKSLGKTTEGHHAQNEKQDDFEIKKSVLTFPVFSFGVTSNSAAKTATQTVFEDGDVATKATATVTPSVFHFGATSPAVVASNKQPAPATANTKLAGNESDTTSVSVEGENLASTEAKSSPNPATRPSGSTAASTVNPTDIFASPSAQLSDATKQKFPQQSVKKARVPALSIEYATPRYQAHGFDITAIHFTPANSQTIRVGAQGLDWIKNTPDLIITPTPMPNNTRITVSQWMNTVLVNSAVSIRESLLLVLGTPTNITPTIFSKTARRWKDAIAHRGYPSIGFMGINDFVLQTAHYFDKYPSLTVQVLLDTDSLWELLPPRIAKVLRTKFDKYTACITGFCISQYGVTICARTNDWCPITPEISPAELNFIADQAKIQGSASTDSRVTTSSLHRVGVVRGIDSNADVTTATICIGRAFLNQAKLLEDLLVSKDHAHKSILVIGPPGSGKTTLLRDIARQLRLPPHETFAIDTWNELGGGGAKPHEGLGTPVIRYMIGDREQQGAVIRDCIRNHRVRTLIVDEAELEDDFMALRTAKERGVRLIVGIQGSFKDLYTTVPQLGAVMRTAVTTRMTGANNLISSSNGALFNAVVEMTEVPMSVKVTLDFAKAARNGFQGGVIRFYNPETGAICIKSA